MPRETTCLTSGCDAAAAAAAAAGTTLTAGTPSGDLSVGLNRREQAREERDYHTKSRNHAELSLLPEARIDRCKCWKRAEKKERNSGGGGGGGGGGIFSQHSA